MAIGMVKKPTLILVGRTGTKEFGYVGNPLTIKNKSFSLFPDKYIILFFNLKKQLMIVVIIGPNPVFPSERISIEFILITIQFLGIQVEATNLIGFAV